MSSKVTFAVPKSESVGMQPTGKSAMTASAAQTESSTVNDKTAKAGWGSVLRLRGGGCCECLGCFLCGMCVEEEILDN